MVVGGMQLKRVDLLGIRRRIGAALGQEKLRKYWEILKRYTQFLISKFELDVHAAAGQLLACPRCRSQVGSNTDISVGGSAGSGECSAAQ